MQISRKKLLSLCVYEQLWKYVFLYVVNKLEPRYAWKYSISIQISRVLLHTYDTNNSSVYFISYYQEVV
jgi:hypothetical protein